MAKYYIWKDKNCNGVNIEWLELTGKEFRDFCREPENRTRRIIILKDTEEGGNTVFIEVNNEIYEEWKKDANRRFYLNEVYDEFVTVSYYETKEDEEPLVDSFEDTDDPIEDRVIGKIGIEKLLEVLEKMNEDERDIIYTIYVKGINIKALANEMEIPYTTFYARVKKILKKMKKLFEF